MAQQLNTATLNHAHTFTAVALRNVVFCAIEVLLEGQK
jgi:hypothetical protein